MKRWMLVVAAALVVLGKVDVGIAAAQAQCYRLVCDQSNTCKAALTSQGNCCCDVDCVGGEGGVSCTCTASCSRICGVSCPNCDSCGQGLMDQGESYVFDSDKYAVTAETHQLAASILRNLTRRYKGPVRSQVAEGMTNLGGKGDYRYRTVVSARETFLTMDIVYSVAGRYSPRQDLPLAEKVTVDALGFATVTPLSPAEVAAATAATSECLGGGNAALRDSALDVVAAFASKQATY